MSPAVTIKMTPDVAEMFADCEPGESKWVKLYVESKDENFIKATPEEVRYEEEPLEEEEELAAEPVPKPVSKLEAVIGKKR